MRRPAKKEIPADDCPSTGFDNSAFARVNREALQSWELRKHLIEKIEGRLQGKVLVYFTSFTTEKAMITDSDAEMIENLLSAEHTGGKVFLVLSSAGGLALAAERIVNVCRAYSKDRFEVIVPHMAKSAATLICFGASRVHMSATSELGPVDPQLKYVNDAQQEVWISAAEYVRSYDELMDKAISGKAKRLETLVQQLARYDARHIEQLKSAQTLAKSISVKLLKSGMMSRAAVRTIERKINPFLLQEQTRAHGRMISAKECKECGLEVKDIPLQSEVWSWLWELYVRADLVVSSRQQKIIETATTAVSA